jgi:hypothetical protein
MSQSSHAGDLLAHCQEFLDWRAAAAYDPANLSSYYTEDAVVEDKTTEESRRGHKEIGEWVKEYSGSGFDATATVRKCYLESNHAVLEWTWSGVKDEAVNFSVDGVGIFDLTTDGRIAREVHYWAHPTWSIGSAE